MWIEKLITCQCCLCAQPSYTRNVCLPCINDLPWITHGCHYCADKVPANVSTCAACQKKRPYFDRTFAALHYTTPISQFITQLKFSQQLIHRKTLAELLSFYIQSELIKLPELLIPVPLHRQRLRQRGFNQAIEVAKWTKKLLDIPIDRLSIQRTRATLPQSQLNSTQRKNNLKGAFVLKKPIRAQHVAILDDVVTTGSTVNELARLLKKNGAQRVDVWACARA